MIKNNFKIFDRVINKNSPTLIIAEIGINHMGNEGLCKEMILSALDSGADCVKLQTVNEEESYLPNTESYKIFKGTHLNYASLKRLSNFAKDNNGFLFSTPADFSSLDLLNSIDVCAYKISSGLLTNSPLLDKMGTYNKPIILSTGMANEIEISNAVNLLKKKKVENIALLHCVSLYPASFSTLNLNFINKLSKKHDLITGYSDHSKGNLACLAAVSIGAKIIEKHFTIDSSINGADNKTSMEPQEFRDMCIKIRNIEDMLYKSNDKPHALELKLKNNRFRKVVAKRDIKKGEKIIIENVNFMRGEDNSNNFINAYDWHKIEGKGCIKNIKKHSFITIDLLDN